MKISLSKDKLSEALSYISKIISLKIPGISLSGVQFFFKDNNLYLLANKTPFACKVSYGQVSYGNCSYVIDYNALIPILKYSREEQINFDFTDKKLLIEDGQNNYKLAYLANVDFNFIFDTTKISEQSFLTVSVEALSDVVNFTSNCISSSNINKDLNGFYYDGNFATTCHVSLAIYPFGETKEKVFIANDGLTMISSLSNKKDMFNFYKVDTVIVAKNDTAMFILPLLNSKFPFYKSIVEQVKSFDNKIIFNRKQLKEACQASLPFTDEQYRTSVEFTFLRDKVIIESRSETQEGEIIILPNSINLVEELTFLLNLRHLIDFVSKLNTEAIELSFSKDSKICCITGDGSKIYLESKVIKK